MKTEFMEGMKRSKMCSEVSLEDLEKEVTLMGWVDTRRDMGGIIFIDLRDRSGKIQVVFNNSTVSQDMMEKAESLRNEYVIGIKGIVVKRDEATVNPNIPTGNIEVMVSELRIFSKSDVLPFQIEEETNVNEYTRLKYRYLDLRRPDMKDNLIVRHRVAKIARDYFDNNGFVEIETPMLTKSTPEGARDYLVPSRLNPGEFYALPQAPQQFKQLLMV